MPKLKITSAMELEALVQQMGVLPFFSCSIPSFSIEEFTPSRYWFVEGVEGPWEWRMELARRQMQTYVTVHSFEYARDKHGRPYGWGIAKYAVTEDVLGADVTQGAYHRDPEESKARIIDHLGQLFPEAFDGDLAKFIR